MSAEPLLTSDVIGLTKVAPFSRRGFMTASAARTQPDCAWLSLTGLLEGKEPAGFIQV